ncbi:hypothetical protein AX14_007772, partial [Amanita brunnescens Koide BX004]
ARKKAGSLEPWANLTVKQIKEIVDEVFGDSVHEVTEDGVWVNQRLHTWHGDFGQKALDTVNFLIEENRAVLYTKALVAEQMATYLQKVPVWPGSDLHKYAYQYSDWDPETNDPQLDAFGLNPLVLRTFALAHLASLDGNDDFTQERPVGALILAMQAVGCAIEHWKDGEKPNTKPPAFSANNFADTWLSNKDAAGTCGKVPKTRLCCATIFVQTLKDLEASHWDKIINEACIYLEPKKKSCDHLLSTTVAEEEEEDPDTDFVME